MPNNLKIINVGNAGNIEKEFVTLEVMADKVNIANYLLMDDTFTGDHQASNSNRHVYIFPRLVFNSGDIISLRTRSGTDGLIHNPKGNDFYALHWNHKKSVWNKDGDTAHLFYAPISNRQSTTVKPIK